MLHDTHFQLKGVHTSISYRCVSKRLLKWLYKHKQMISHWQKHKLRHSETLSYAKWYTHKLFVWRNCDHFVTITSFILHQKLHKKVTARFFFRCRFLLGNSFINSLLKTSFIMSHLNWDWCSLQYFFFLLLLFIVFMETFWMSIKCVALTIKWCFKWVALKSILLIL